MKFYLAPLEGITGYIYRNALHDFYGKGIDKYFMPFLAPHTKRSFSAKEKNDILPEHNKALYAVPQILTNNASDFLRIEKDLRALGYEEININLGCPSGTVVSKGRGAGFLAKKDELDAFLEEIFEKAEGKISLKTRIGMEKPEEFYELLEIYNKYPLEELIIHPRVQKELYQGKPHMEIFHYARKYSKNPLCYNGDIYTKEDYVNRIKEWESEDDKEESLMDVSAIMLGRGVLKTPWLIKELAGDAFSEEKEAVTDKQKLLAFHDRLLTDYKSVMSGDKNVLFKMKELWMYLQYQFEDREKTAKKIKKANNLMEYQAAVREIFSLQR